MSLSRATDGLAAAVQAASDNPITGLPKHGAVLTNGVVSFVGLNSRERHPLQDKFKKHEQAIHLHAEIASIAAAVEAGHTDLSTFSLYVARVYRDSTKSPAKGAQRLHGAWTGPSKPCAGCCGAIAAFKLKEVFHT